MRAARALGLVVATALAATAPLACGSEERDAEPAKPVGQELAGSVAAMAQCSDWTGGTRAERVATIHDIRAQVNLKDSAVQTPELSDRAAYEVIDNTCAEDFASGFRLYKLYARAASFAAFTD